MTATESNDHGRQEDTESENIAPTRRDALTAIATLAAGRWAAEGYDPANVGSWDPIDGIYSVGEFDPMAVSAVANTPTAAIEMMGEHAPDREVGVGYDEAGVSLDVGAANDEVTIGAVATLEPAQARAVAADLYRAAEELERRDDGPA